MNFLLLGRICFYCGDFHHYSEFAFAVRNLVHLLQGICIAATVICFWSRVCYFHDEADFAETVLAHSSEVPRRKRNKRIMIG